MGIKTVVLLMILGLALTQTSGLDLRDLLENLGQGEGGSTLTLEGVAEELHQLEQHLMGKNKMEIKVLNNMAEGTLEFLCGMADTLLKDRDDMDDMDGGEGGEEGDEHNPPPESVRRQLMRRILDAIQDEQGTHDDPKEGPLLSKICPLLKEMHHGDPEDNVNEMP